MGGTGVTAEAGIGMGAGTTPKETVGTAWTDGTAATDGTDETELDGSYRVSGVGGAVGAFQGLPVFQRLPVFQGSAASALVPTSEERSATMQTQRSVLDSISELYFRSRSPA